MRQIEVHAVNLLEDTGLTAKTDGHALRFIAVYGPVKPSEVARVLGLAPSTLTSLIDRLVGQGVVVRTENPKDRRSHLLATTEKGDALVVQMDDKMFAFEDELIESLGEGDLEAIHRLFERIGEMTGVDLRKDPSDDDRNHET